MASYVQATIENKGIALSGKEVSLEIGVEVDGEMEYIPMGLYTIQNPKIESNKVTFTAYDRLASRCNGAYYSKLSYPTDAVDILAEISTITGVAIDTSTLQRGIQINQRAIIEEGDYNEETEESEVITTYVNPFDGYTYKETIGFIAGLFGKFAICGRTGMIEFRWYQGIDYEIPSNIFYNDLQETEESFSIKRLTCDNSDQTLSSGSGATGISMQNPVMTQSILDGVYNTVQGLVFTPAALRFIGDTRLDIGDIVTAVKNDGMKFTIPIISLITSYDGGLMQTIASYGNTAEEDDSDTKGPITEMAERVEYELAFVKKLMVDNLTATNATIKNLSGDVLKFKTGEFETLKTDVANFKQTFTDDLQASNAKINTLESDHATFKEATATNLNATNARIANIEADYLKATDAKLTYATITNLNTTNAEITKLKTKDAEIDKLVATKATITDLNAAVGRVGLLESSYANLNTLVNGNLTSDNIQNLTLTSKNTTIENGMIKNAMIENLSFDKITGMDINTTNLTVHSSDGKSKWSDNTIQISDANRVRVQIGKDASNDYSMSVWDKNGNLIWDALGATEKTIQRKIIRDGIVADDANISGSKLDINSVIKEVNGSTTKLKSSTIVMNDKNQTLDVVFNEMETTIADNLSSAKLYADGKLSDAQKYALEQANSALSSAKSYADSAVDNITEITTSHTTSISTMQGQISSLISEDTMIKGNYDALLSRYNATVNTVDSMKTTIGEHTTILNSQNDSIAAVTTKANTIESNLAGTTQTVSEVKSNLAGTQERVTKVETNLTGLTTRVSSTETNLANLEIGGRNLLTNSKLLTDPKGKCNWVQSVINDCSFNGYSDQGLHFTTNNNGVANSNGISFVIQRTKLGLKTGDTITFSADVKGTIGTGDPLMQYWSSKKTDGTFYSRREFGDSLKSVKSDGYTRYSVTVILEDLYKEVTDSDYLCIGGGFNADLYIKNIKLEKGSKATDWTPAPEDVDQKITAAETIASQTADKFNWLVKSGTNSTDFELTDRTATLVASAINMNGLVKFSGLNTDAKNEIGKVAQSKVDGLEVGGRNLLKGTHRNAVSFAYPTTGLSDKYSWQTTIPLNGDTYTLSFWAKSTVAGDKIRVHFYNPSNIQSIVGSQGQKSTAADGLCDFTLSTTLTKYWVTYKIPKGGNSTRWIIIPRIGAQSSTSTPTGSGTITLQWEQLEEGSKASGYNPAPEDTDSAIDTAKQGAIETAQGYAKNAVNWVTSNGSSTTSLNLMVKKWTDGAVSDTAQINGGWIKANTITASKIAVGDFTNYADINESNTHGFSVEKTTDGVWFSKDGSKLTRDNYISKMYSCEPGQTFYVEYDISNTIKDSTEYKAAGIMLFGCDGTQTVKWYQRRGAVVGTAAGTVTHMSQQLTMPSGTRFFYVVLQIEGHPPFTGTLKIRNLSVRKAVTGAVIVDGSITADKIDVNSIFAKDITATGTITGANLIGATGTFSGQITATEGTIGKYEITDTCLITGSGSACTGIGGNFAFWAGGEDSYLAPFRVGYDGQLNIEHIKVHGNQEDVYMTIAKDYLMIQDVNTSAYIGLDGFDFDFANSRIKTGDQGIELYGDTPYIDFHYNNSYNDYTSRIIAQKGWDCLNFTGSIELGADLYAGGYIYNSSGGHYTWNGRTDAYISCGNYNNTNNIYYYAGYHAFYVNGDSGSGMMYIETSGVSSRKGFRNSSDERIKKDFQYFDDDFIKSYMQLEPIKYRFKDDTDISYHIGFKAQNVNSVLNDYGKSHNEQFGICATHHIDPEYAEKTYGENNMTEVYTLAYDELIGANTFMIQKTRKDLIYQAGRIDMQEAIINDLQTRLLQAEKTIKQLTKALA